jgi:O-antigen chain-terminating methyltransferase
VKKALVKKTRVKKATVKKALVKKTPVKKATVKKAFVDKASFYRAFEDRYRGKRELIKSRLEVYLPFVQPLVQVNRSFQGLDLGCGRGEWLELMHDNKIDVRGIDHDAKMLESIENNRLNVSHGDAIAELRSLPNESLLMISGFHLAEHLKFDVLRRLIAESARVLKPGGLLILETPNPENLVVGTASFYLDPTHEKPIPFELLSFMVEYSGFERTKVLRLNELEGLIDAESIILLSVLNGASPDYSVIGQKPGSSEAESVLDNAFGVEYGASLEALANKYHWQHNASMEQTEKELAGAYTKLATIKGDQAELKALQATDQAELKALQAKVESDQAELKALQATDQAELKALQATDQAELKALQAKVESDQAELKALQAKVESDQAELKALQATDQAELKAQLAELKALQATDQAELKAQLAEVKAQLTTLVEQAAIEALQGRVESEQAEFKALQAKVETEAHLFYRMGALCRLGIAAFRSKPARDRAILVAKHRIKLTLISLRKYLNVRARLKRILYMPLASVRYLMRRGARQGSSSQASSALSPRALIIFTDIKIALKNKKRGFK